MHGHTQQARPVINRMQAASEMYAAHTENYSAASSHHSPRDATELDLLQNRLRHAVMQANDLNGRLLEISMRLAGHRPIPLSGSACDPNVKVEPQGHLGEMQQSLDALFNALERIDGVIGVMGAVI